MKRSLYQLAAVLCLSLALLAATHLTVGAASDQVELAETVLAGDRAAARGLEITYLTNDNSRHLFWDTYLTLGGDLEPEVDFQFCQGVWPREYRPSYTASLSCTGLNFGMSGHIVEEDPVAHREFMYLPALDVAKRTGPGERRTEVLRLRDFYDCFLLSLDVSTIQGPNISSSRWGQSILDDTAYQQLLDYFRVPVPEDLMITATAERNEKGVLVNIACEPGEVGEDGGIHAEEVWNDPFSAWGLVAEDAIYLLATPALQGPDTVETGIHVIPLIVDEDNQPRLELDSIRLLRPLDLEQDELLELEWNQDRSRMMLFTREAGRLVLYVIDPATGEMDQRMDLTDIGSEDWASFTHCGALHLIDRNGEGFVLLQEEDGRFTRLLTGAMDLPRPLGNMFSSRTQLAWDGEKLAAAGQIDGRGYPDTPPEEQWPSGFGAAVWDGDGLQYAGFYEYLPGRDWSNWYNGYYQNVFPGEVDRAVWGR